MNLWKKLALLFTTLLLVAFPTFGQDMTSPSVTVDGQIVVDDTVRITEVVSDGPGFVVIHATMEDGSFGDVLGHAPVGAGVNHNVVINIDPTEATDTVYAMLHIDDGVIGDYEFDSDTSVDAPLLVNEQIIAPTFNVEILSASDQFVEDQVVIDSVTMSADGFVVIHADNGEGAPGEVIGVNPVVAGTSTNVIVELDGELTDTIFPMLHFDTGVAGEYEFGTVDGADSPVVIDGAVATTPIWTVPHMRIPDQAIIVGDGQEMSENMLHVKSVLSDGPGFVVIHADNNGQPGEVIGFAGIESGLTTNLMVTIDGDVTPVVFPMLHVDTGTIGEYEFGTVDGVDGPVTVNDQVIVFPVDVAPSIKFAGILQDNMLTVEKAVIDHDGWLVIHADNGDGAPGEVIGATRLREGVNFDTTVELDTEMMTETVFPMLHYDTGEIGAYEFGAVDGADLPVSVDGLVVVGALNPVVIE